MTSEVSSILGGVIKARAAGSSDPASRPRDPFPPQPFSGPGGHFLFHRAHPRADSRPSAAGVSRRPRAGEALPSPAPPGNSPGCCIPAPCRAPGPPLVRPPPPPASLASPAGRTGRRTTKSAGGACGTSRRYRPAPCPGPASAALGIYGRQSRSAAPSRSPAPGAERWPRW